MRVLINGLQAANRSGTGTYVTELARWLPKVAPAGMEIRVLWPSGAPIPEDAVDEAFVPAPVLGPVGRVLYDQSRLLQEARRWNADVVHYPANVGALRAVPNMVLTIHDLSFVKNPGWFRWERAQYYRWAACRSAKLATRIIAVSQATAHDLTSLLGLPEERITVVLNGVSETLEPASQEVQRTVREKYGLPQAFFLYLGTIEPRKNLVRLVKAFDQVAAHVQLDLVIAGRTGWKTGPVEAAISAAHRRDRIHRIGYVPAADMNALLSAACIFTYPSLYEGFGIPVAEAMACGTPVITSNVSSLPEVAGDSALLIDPEDIDDLAHKMRLLAGDPTQRQALTEKGRTQAAAFSWVRAAEATCDAYASCG